MNRRRFIRHILLLLPALILWPKKVVAKKGISTIFDELHRQSDYGLWNVMNGAKRIKVAMNIPRYQNMTFPKQFKTSKISEFQKIRVKWQR